MLLLARVWSGRSVKASVACAWAGAYALALGLAQFLAHAPAWRFDSPVQYGSDLAVAVGLAWACYLAVSAGSVADRRRWLLASAAMVLLSVVQATDWLVDAGELQDDWLVDLLLWLLATVMLHRVLCRGSAPWALDLWHAGLALQLAFVVLDFGDGRFVRDWLSADALASLTEWVELLAIDCNVVALVLAGARSARGAVVARVPVAALGSEARRLYEAGQLFSKANYPPLRWAFYPGVRTPLLIAVALGLLVRVGPLARRATGRSLFAQLRDLLVLGLGEDFDPLSYYLQELYRAGGRAEAAHYLTRHETKNGLLGALNRMRPQPYAGTEMGDKLLFDDCCRRSGLAAAAVLLSCDGTGADWRVARSELDHDLFCKPRAGRGARGVMVFRRIAHETYRTPDGRTLGLEALVERLVQAGRSRPLIVQRRLNNHADVADLADQSLVTIRVLTCLDAADRPVPTHGMLRILCKLEPGWKLGDELGVPIDLATGRLGCMASDRLGKCAFRYTHHPVTGQRIEGRVLTTWPALMALAVAAHRAFGHRILIGWDIAATDQGPVLLEGNSGPDVMFPQRVYSEGFGRGPLAPLLAHHLAVLARARGLQ